jgi:hypothetical protein
MDGMMARQNFQAISVMDFFHHFLQDGEFQKKHSGMYHQVLFQT